MSAVYVSGPHLCSVGEVKPTAGTGLVVRWLCRPCRIALAAAARAGSWPTRPDAIASKARKFGARFDEPWLIETADLIEASARQPSPAVRSGESPATGRAADAYQEWRQ